MSAINKFLTWLNEEIGYLEKKNNDLDYLISYFVYDIFLLTL